LPHAEEILARPGGARRRSRPRAEELIALLPGSDQSEDNDDGGKREQRGRARGSGHGWAPAGMESQAHCIVAARSAQMRCLVHGRGAAYQSAADAPATCWETTRTFRGVLGRTAKARINWPTANLSASCSVGNSFTN